jgi:hypothetical protein
VSAGQLIRCQPVCNFYYFITALPKRRAVRVRTQRFIIDDENTLRKDGFAKPWP